jgi:hypothetical protein
VLIGGRSQARKQIVPNAVCGPSGQTANPQHVSAREMNIQAYFE